MTGNLLIKRKFEVGYRDGAKMTRDKTRMYMIQVLFCHAVSCGIMYIVSCVYSLYWCRYIYSIYYTTVL